MKNLNRQQEIQKTVDELVPLTVWEHGRLRSHIEQAIELSFISLKLTFEEWTSIHDRLINEMFDLLLESPSYLCDLESGNPAVSPEGQRILEESLALAVSPLHPPDIPVALEFGIL